MGGGAMDAAEMGGGAMDGGAVGAAEMDGGAETQQASARMLRSRRQPSPVWKAWVWGCSLVGVATQAPGRHWHSFSPQTLRCVPR
jgi:hypothetical protein